MTTVADDGDCRLKCWLTAAAIGVVVALFALGAQKGFVAALLLGALAIVLLGKLFIWLFCGPVPRLGESEKARSTAAKLAAAQAVPVAAPAPVAPAAAAAEVVETETREAPAKTEDAVAETAEPTADPKAESAAAVVTPSKPLAGEAELAARKGEWRYEGEAAPAAKDMPVAPAAAAAVPEGEGSQPEALSAAREGGPDNLKEIKGVGPKLEALLHDLGIYHFDQIAGWSAAEVAWMDSNLKGFRGRVSRDDWIGQAKLLAAGGETEFSKRVEGGDVY